jgi:two-component sensor histidine kinase
MINESNYEEKKIEKYINNFDEKAIEVQKAKTLIKTHEIILALIDEDLDKGISLSEAIINNAKKLNDTNLLIIGLYHKTDFLITQGKLSEFIKVSDEAFMLDSVRENKSSYYQANLMHLVDALIYKGGNEERVIKLLQILYDHPDTKYSSFAFYSKFLTYTKPHSEYLKPILDQFECKDVISFTKKIKNLSKPVLNSNEYYYLLLESYKCLKHYDFYKEANDFLFETLTLRKEIYAKDLAESLSDYKTRAVREEKEKEIKNQKEKTNLYIVLAILSCLLMIISIFAFIKKRKRSFLLEKQNTEIETQRELLEKSDAEKGYFLKEIHHRVKNNFQIIASLLEIQFKQNETEETKQLINDSRSRVKSMALIHQRLYQNDDLHIGLEDYLKELVAEIQNTFSLTGKLEIGIDVDPNYILDIDTAIPIGLIVNELVTNTFKYGLTEGVNTLNISLSSDKDEAKVLTLSDNGPGLPEGIEISESTTVGLKLVRRLAKQLHGKVVYKYNNGAQFSVSFKDASLRALID